jgi:hypothetical protein
LYLFYLFCETESYSVAQAGPEVKILLLQAPKCWDYRHVPPHLARPFFLKSHLAPLPLENTVLLLLLSFFYSTILSIFDLLYLLL